MLFCGAGATLIGYAMQGFLKVRCGCEWMNHMLYSGCTLGEGDVSLVLRQFMYSSSVMTHFRKVFAPAQLLSSFHNSSFVIIVPSRDLMSCTHAA